MEGYKRIETKNVTTKSETLTVSEVRQACQQKAADGVKL